MPYIQFNDQQFPLGPADLTVGAYDGAVARLPGNDPRARAVLKLGADGTGYVSRGGPDALVFLNGVQVGAEPSPILHGDKLEVGGHALLYGTEEVVVPYPMIQRSLIPETFESRIARPRQPAAPTGGRLVSLVDGREYTIGRLGVTIGREIGCEIVVGSTDVSRKHASIKHTSDGYLLKDLSTNGVLVNKKRVDAEQVLQRGDVIRIGPEDFRFHADEAKSSTEPGPTAVAAPSLSNTGYMPARPASMKPGVPAAVTIPTSARPALATLEIINEGPTKGTRFELFNLLTNIGRGGHNDVVVNDESLSTSHAKIFKRDGSWWITDQNSTNGTYVGGVRVEGERPLPGSPDVRFGNVKMTFRAAAPPADGGPKGTVAIAAAGVPEVRKPTAELKSVAGTAVAKKKGCAAVIAIFVALAAVGSSMLVALLTTRG